MAERASFAKLAGQCAQLSNALDVLYDNSDTPNSSLQFSHLEDAEFEAVRQGMLSGESGLDAFISSEQLKSRNTDEESLASFLSSSFSKLLK